MCFVLAKVSPKYDDGIFHETSSANDKFSSGLLNGIFIGVGIFLSAVFLSILVKVIPHSTRNPILVTIGRGEFSGTGTGDEVPP